MRNRLQTRVPHLSDSGIVAKVGLVRGLGVLLVGATGAAHAQSCGLISMQDSAKLVYPPIARAAHVEGPVVLMTTFRHDGTVAEVTPINGPEMLRTAAITYVKGLRANEYSGPRQCPIVVTFRFDGNSRSCDDPTDHGPGPIGFQRTDLQHVSLTSKSACIFIQPAFPPARR